MAKNMGEEETSTEAMASFTLPCSLLQFLAKACRCCLGLCDSFKDPNDSTTTTTTQQDGINGKQSNDPNGSSQEQENGKTNPTGDNANLESMAAGRKPTARSPVQGKPPQHNTINS